MHPLDEALALQPQGDGVFRGHTHPAWANMVGPFGGITAAQLLQAACTDPRRLGEPLALTVNYAAAVADGPFDIVAVPARTNRSTQHWTLELRQGGQVCTTASAVFAVRRATWSAPELAMPGVPPKSEPSSSGPHSSAATAGRRCRSRQRLSGLLKGQAQRQRRSQRGPGQGRRPV